MMKTILRIVYLLAAAGIVFAGLYWYASDKAKATPAGQPASGELRRVGQEKNRGEVISPPDGTRPDGGTLRMGHGSDLIKGEPEFLILIRNLVWVTGAIILVLLLQAGWRKLARRKAKVKTGSV